MSFYCHGKLSFQIENEILVIEGAGPWNMEAMVKSIEDVNEIHRKLYGKKWAVLAIITGTPIHTPDAGKLLSKIVTKDKKNGRVATALVLEESCNPNFGRHHIAEIYKTAGEKFEFFRDISSAKNWLKTQLKLR